VVITEKYDKKATKYTAPAAPFPFTSKEAYERSLRQPLGREYNPDVAFRDLTRPAVLKQAGVTIEPLRFSEPLAKELGHTGKKAEAEREARRVVTVAGGMPTRGKKAAS
jgi:U3 small nucleolar RNA-associated protein 14